tara:strand:- start:400 stop:951 length:552 start_codon:yes stop_codon:yes gene_type:complete
MGGCLHKQAPAPCTPDPTNPGHHKVFNCPVGASYHVDGGCSGSIETTTEQLKDAKKTKLMTAFSYDYSGSPGRQNLLCNQGKGTWTRKGDTFTCGLAPGDPGQSPSDGPLNSPYPQPPAGMSQQTMIYIGIGVGVLFLFYLMMKKKGAAKPSLTGQPAASPASPGGAGGADLAALLSSPAPTM